MTLSPWTPISLWRQTPECLAWWRVVLGADFDAARAFLKPCMGLAATSYPCPDTGLRLTIRETDGRYLAFPTGDDASDADDRALEWDDVQAWQVDGPGLRGDLARLLKLSPGPETPDGAEIECLGICNLCRKQRRVFLCHAVNGENALTSAENTGATAEAGCLCFAERYPGVETVLRGRGAAMVVLAESVAFGADGLTGSCGEACRGVGAKDEAAVIGWVGLDKPSSDRAHSSFKNEGPEIESLSMTDKLLFKIAMSCVDLDRGNRKTPSHWEVFLAAWKDGRSAYEMERRRGWNRRTADYRLRTVEKKCLAGARVSEMQFDPAILKNVEAQLKSSRDHHAEKLHRQDLLDNTTGDADEES